jgi:hypothetical protein
MGLLFWGGTKLLLVPLSTLLLNWYKVAVEKRSNQSSQVARFLVCVKAIKTLGISVVLLFVSWIYFKEHISL